MNYLKNILVLVILANSGIASSQSLLTLDEAISSAMEKNFDIKMVNNNLLMAENNQSIQNSGYLPTISASANGNYANNNAFVVDQQDQEFSIDGIQTTSYGANVALNYNIYAGGVRKHSYDKLKSAYELSDVQRQLQIDNTLLNIYNTYYSIAKTQIQLGILEESFEISKRRLIRTQYQYEFSQKTGLDVLNAKVDVNTDSLNMLNASIQLANTKRQLNYLLGSDINTDFEVDETVETNQLLDFESIRQNVDVNNNQHKQLMIQSKMAEYDLKVNQSNWVPTLSTTVSYGFNNSQNGPASLFAVQNITGLNAGLNLNWNIFDGGSTNVRVQNAKISIENQELLRQQLNLNLETELATLWAEYSNQLVVLNSEELNLEVAEQNFLRTEERYNLGQVTSIDFRQAQLNLINTKMNLANAEFGVKIAEIQLKRLEGSLVEQ